MANRLEAGDLAAEALENLDEALSNAVEHLSIYLDLNHPPDDRSAPADLLAAVLHSYAQRQHPTSDLPLTSLSKVIDEVLEAREESDWLRSIDQEKYGYQAGDLLASFRDTARRIPPRSLDRLEVDDALSRYCEKVDRFIGETAGLPAKQKVPKNSKDLDRYGAAIDEAMMLYWRHPDRFVVNISTAEIGKESVFEFVAPKYGIQPKTLYNQYNAKVSSELKARLAKRARERRREQ